MFKKTFAFVGILLISSFLNAATVSYTLDNVFLDNGMQVTGAFDWDYTIGDFEGGSGVFTALEIPVQPNGSAPPLENPNMVISIENNQIEISLDGNFHDYGLDIIMKFVQPLSPTQSSLIDLNTSFYECCGNGFQDHFFSSGSISPIDPFGVIANVPLPFWATLILGLIFIRIINYGRHA